MDRELVFMREEIPTYHDQFLFSLHEKNNFYFLNFPDTL